MAVIGAALLLAVGRALARIHVELGRISHPSFQPGGAAPIAPSAIRPDGQACADPNTARTQNGRDPVIVEQYARAARNALAAGFDGLEVHAANGYLPPFPG